MRVNGRAILILLAGLASAGLSHAAEAFDWSGRLAPGDILEVRGIEGDIRASAAAGGTARVVARTRGRGTGDYEVRMAERRGGVTICVVPADRPDRGDPCDDDRGRQDWPRDSEWISFDVEVPDGVELVARTISGDVEALDLRSRVDGATVNGSVRLSTTGVATATTVSGDIEVEMGEFGDRPLDFTTVSGDIRLTLPDDLNARVEFESLSGRLSSEFEMEIVREKEQMVGSEIEGRIGRGGPRLTLTTVSGDVDLRRPTR